MKSLAKETDTALVMLVQVGRKFSSGKDELSIEAARDSGAIEESADILLGAWRPEKDEENDDTIVLGILKGRKGGAGKKITCNFDPTSLNISERLRD